MDPDVRKSAALLHERLLAQGLTIASAESLTGGGLAELLSGTAGASSSYVGGVVSYATEVKQRLLHVSEATVREHGVVSAQCAGEMARGAREWVGADLGVSTTGVAGPTTQEDKPVGLVFVAVADAEGTEVHELHLAGDRTEIRAETCASALDAIAERLDRWTGREGVGRAP